MGDKYDPEKLFFEGHDVWSEIKEESNDTEKSIDKEKSTDVPTIPPLEGDEEEAREGKGLKILTPNKLLTRLPVKNWKQFKQIKK